MKRHLFVGLAVLAGCQSQPSPDPGPDYSSMTKCEQVAAALGDPRVNSTAKAVALEVGRNNYCFGERPAQRIELDHTVRIAQ